jgi:hypothetical protein
LAADKFNILPLQKLAATRLINWASSNSMSAEFPQIIQEIWCSISHERELLDTISKIVSSNIKQILTQECGDSVLIANPEITKFGKTWLMMKLNLENMLIKL